jgi:tyrosyl-tRNA synthetase
MFGSRSIGKNILPSSRIPRDADLSDNGSVPCTVMDAKTIQDGIPAFKLYHQIGLSGSGGDARRLIQQGGAYINEKRLESFDYLITEADFLDGEIVLRAGKKRYHKIKIDKV